MDGTVTRIKCWHLMLLQTTDVFPSVHVLTFTLHLHDLTFISRGREAGGGDPGEMAAKPVTTVQDCVSVFVSV